MRHRTVRALAESLRLDLEAAVEPSAVVLPRDHRRQLHELCIIELRPKRREQFVGDVGGRRRQPFRVLDDGLLERRERVGSLVPMDVS